MAAVSKHYALINHHLPCQVLHPWTTSCFLNGLNAFFNGFKGSTKFFLILHLANLLIKRKQKWLNQEGLLRDFYSYIRSCLFGATSTGLTVCFICFFRQLIGRFYVVFIGLIPGLIGGAGIFFESPSRRGLDTTLFLSVVTKLYLKLLQEQGFISLPPLMRLLMFTVCSSGLLYCLRSIPNSYSLMWPLVPNRVPSDPEAQKHCRHKGRCLHSIQKVAVSYLFYGVVIQGIKVITINFKSLLSKPNLLCSIIVNRNNLYFPLFLVSYFSLFQSVSCLLVNLRGRDESWQALLAGGVASLSYLIQPDITLTCLAFSNLSQILCREYKKKLKLPPWPWEEILYMVLNGMLFHARAAYRHSFPSNMTSTMDTVTAGTAKYVYDLVEKNLVKRW